MEYTSKFTTNRFDYYGTSYTIEVPNTRSYFGRLIANGGMKEVIRKYDLKKRLYLGPTSLDDSLALLLANISKTRFNCLRSLCGHSIHFGRSYSFWSYLRSDIDPRVLRGEMYADCGNRNYTSEGFFDVIVTDPPYGIRAGAKKSGELLYRIDEERRKDHIPAVQPYPVEEVMLDLLHTAATSLVCGGVLTYLIPTTYDFGTEDLPVHPCLNLLQVCHQPLCYSPELRAAFVTYKQQVVTGQDSGFGRLMSKLEAALAADAFDNAAVVKSLSSCSNKRRISKDLRRKKREERDSTHTESVDDIN
eukprot:gene18667-18965_t